MDPLLDLPHGGRTRIRASVNAQGVAGRFEGGTDPVAVRLGGLGRLARAGYPVGLTIAPIMPVDGWGEEYGALLDAAAAELSGVPALDLRLSASPTGSPATARKYSPVRAHVVAVRGDLRGDQCEHALAVGVLVDHVPAAALPPGVPPI